MTNLSHFSCLTHASVCENPYKFLINILIRPIAKFCNSDDENVIAVESRLTKTRSTSLYKKWVFGLSSLRPSALISGTQSLAPGPHKVFNQLNFLLFKVQSLWSCAHYFRWFMGYVNHVDLLMSHVHVLRKAPYCCAKNALKIQGTPSIADILTSDKNLVLFF